MKKQANRSTRTSAGPLGKRWKRYSRRRFGVFGPVDHSKTINYIGSSTSSKSEVITKKLYVSLARIESMIISGPIGPKRCKAYSRRGFKDL